MAAAASYWEIKIGWATSDGLVAGRIPTSARYWAHLKARNGRILATTETYKRKRDALHAIGVIRAAYVLDFPDGGGTLRLPELEVRDMTEDTPTATVEEQP